MDSRQKDAEFSEYLKSKYHSNESDLDPVLNAFTEQIKFYGEFLRDNDRKRDQFVRFYLSILVAAIGFGLISLNLNTSSAPVVNLSQRLFVIFPLLLSVSLIIGILTFSVILKFRNLHTYYVKMVNRNRGFFVKIVSSKVPEIGAQMADAWDEHIYDDFPKFLQTKGLEHSITRFHAIMNSFVFGIIGFLTSFSNISEFAVDGNIIKGVVKLLIWSAVAFGVHMLWQRTILKDQDEKYKPKLSRTN